MSRMDHWSVVAMVSVPAMTRSSMDAIKLSSWKRLSFLFFSLKNTRGKKSHKTISLSIQQAQEMLHSLQHSWLGSCVCELGDKIDLSFHQRWSTTDGRFGGEFWVNIHLPWKQTETQSQLLLTDSALQVWKEPGLCPEQEQIQLILSLRDSSCPRPGLNPQQCSKSPFRPFLPGL